MGLEKKWLARFIAPGRNIVRRWATGRKLTRRAGRRLDEWKAMGEFRRRKAG